MISSTEAVFSGDGGRAGGRWEPGELVVSIVEGVVVMIVVEMLLVIVIVVVLKSGSSG